MNPADAAAFANLMDDITAIVIVVVSVCAAAWLISQVLKHRAGQKIAPAEAAMLEQMTRIAERMESRMTAVERILDADTPTWRGGTATGGVHERRAS